MVTFGIRIKGIDEKLIKFFKDSNDRLQSGSKIGKVIEGYFKKINEDSYIICFNYLYPKIYYLGFLYILIYILVNHFNIGFWLIPAFVIFGLRFFWSKYFILVMLYIALLKYNKKYNIKLLSNEEIINILVK